MGIPNLNRRALLVSAAASTAAVAVIGLASDAKPAGSDDPIYQLITDLERAEHDVDEAIALQDDREIALRNAGLNPIWPEDDAEWQLAHARLLVALGVHERAEIAMRRTAPTTMAGFLAKLESIASRDGANPEIAADEQDIDFLVQEQHRILVTAFRALLVREAM
jgi:hypothetical protein